jgi:hypothetical protein
MHGSFQVQLTAKFSEETTQARSKWHEILKILNGKNLHASVLPLSIINVAIFKILSFNLHAKDMNALGSRYN